jgi:hypothetical protein
MKAQTTRKAITPVQADKRELVNIDLYDHEMKLIVEKLKSIAWKHPKAKEVQQTLDRLKKELTRQKRNLEKFRKNCEPEEISFSKVTGTAYIKKGEEMRDKSFFENLNSYEVHFKRLRQEANDFVDRWQ